ncbi:hypothetical protein Gasu2_13270 [Galdieria sulphuraria]|nr:hypothetical protein Gasu2_13270 [Galdieria sulphuraria]
MWAFIHGLSWKENIRTNTLGNLTEASHVNKRVKVAPLTIEAGKGARWKDKFRKPPSYEVDPIRALKDPPPEYTIVSQAESTSDIQIESAVEQDS